MNSPKKIRIKQKSRSGNRWYDNYVGEVFKAGAAWSSWGTFRPGSELAVEFSTPTFLTKLIIRAVNITMSPFNMELKAANKKEGPWTSGMFIEEIRR